MQKPIYLDNNATTQLRRESRDTMIEVMDLGLGNPSSPHSLGRQARAVVERARGQVAKLMGTDPELMIFTSGATESINHAIRNWMSTRRSQNRPRLVSLATEHRAVLESLNRFGRNEAEVLLLPVGPSGIVDLHLLASSIEDQESLLSVQWANGDTGVIQPIREIIEICKAGNAAVHCDAAQALGRVPIDISTLDVDYLSFSSHKMHGPGGVGALYLRDPRTAKSLLMGGSQERGLRPGTENVMGIAGFGRAAELRRIELPSAMLHMERLRNEFEKRVLSSTQGAVVNAADASRLCNTTSIRFDGVDGEALVAQLDRNGIICSQTSACVGGQLRPSHTLRAMGHSDDQARSSVRFGLSIFTTQEEVERAAAVVTSICRRIGPASP